MKKRQHPNFMSALALALGRCWQDTDTVAGVFVQLRQEAESIAEAIPQVRILDFFSLTLVSWRANKKMIQLRNAPVASDATSDVTGLRKQLLAWSYGGARIAL